MDKQLMDEQVVKEGIFLYAGEVECDIKIVRSPIRYGSGDYEDPPEIQYDIACETFYIWFGSTTERGVFNSVGGGYPSLKAAMTAAEDSLGIGPTLRWKSS
jgi:hypothetical protein